MEDSGRSVRVGCCQGRSNRKGLGAGNDSPGWIRIGTRCDDDREVSGVV